MKKKNSLMMHKETHLLNDTTPFATREAFNRLRTNLMYTLNDKHTCPIFAVTSDDQAAGKSTIISNVAISYAMSGKKVLLIDADMRAPMQYKIFGLDRKRAGLSELLSGIAETDSEVIFSHHVEGLHLLLAGKMPPNPSELIMSKRFESLLASWSTQYDAIFIDFPPVGIVSDTLAVKHLVTGYLFVVRSAMSDGKRVRAALESMHQVDAKVLGVILNDVHAKEGGYYRKGYSSSYGYGSHYEESYNKTHQKSSKKG